jgi:hypothetical protein
MARDVARARWRCPGSAGLQTAARDHSGRSEDRRSRVRTLLFRTLEWTSASPIHIYIVSWRETYGAGMREGFYRSRLFWLGVPGLVFLLWVWWDSGGYVSYARWVRGNAMDEVRVTGGWVGWERMRHLHASSGGPILKVNPFTVRRFGRVEEVPLEQLCTAKMMGRQFDFSAAFAWDESLIADPISPGEIESLKFHVALWVIVAGYGAMWAAMVIWSQRRKKKWMMSLLTEPEVAG